MNQLSNDDHVMPAGKWVHCSPDYIHTRGKCATDERRPCECPGQEGIGHDHFIPIQA